MMMEGKGALGTPVGAALPQLLKGRYALPTLIGTGLTAKIAVAQDAKDAIGAHALMMLD